jgi:oligopeptide transport system substrate-binding protein
VNLTPGHTAAVFLARSSVLGRAAAGFALCVVIVAGCTRRETPVAAGIQTQTLHFGNDAEPGVLDPHTFTLVAEWTILTSLFEGLVNLANDGTTILPGVAARWEISSDGLTYAFHLRPDVRWSNGDPITSRDFMESFKRMLDPRIGCTSPEFVSPIAGARDYLLGKTTDFSRVGIRAPDAQTVQFTLGYRFPYFLTTVSNATLLGMPLHMPSLDAFGGRNQRAGKWMRPGNLVSNGPFKLKEWRANQVLVVERNSRYWDAARVRLKEIHFHPAEDYGVEERMFRAQQLHTTCQLPPNKFETYRTSQPDAFRAAPLRHTSYIAFNCTRPPFSDARVRRAMALAIDRTVASDSGFRGRSTPAKSFVRPGTGGFEPPSQAVFDPPRARQLLAEAGFPGGTGFPRVELRIPAGRSDSTAMAETLQQLWKQNLGVHVELRQMEPKSLVASLHARDFEMGLTGYYYVDDPSDLFARGEKDSPTNFSGWQDSEYEAALEAVRRATSDAERFAAFAIMEKTLADAAPCLPLCHFNRVHLVHPAVRGWRENPLLQIDWRELSLESK